MGARGLPRRIVISKHRTAQEEKPTPLIRGISTYVPPLPSSGHIPVKGTTFTLREQSLYPIDFTSGLSL